jgi:PAS domain S-box-containing protein
LNGILNATQESIWLFSADGILRMANQIALKRFGRSAEEVIGKHVTELVPPGLAKIRLAHLNTVVQTGKPVEFEDKRGGILFQHTFSPVFDDRGNVTDVAIFSRDITRQRQNEDRLSYLASFPQLNPNPVLEADLTGAVTFANPATLRTLIGLGRDSTDLQAFAPKDLNAILAAWDGRSPSTVHHEIRIKDRVFSATVYLSPELNAVRIYAYDSTERKHIEEALRDSEEKYRLLFRNMGEGFALYELLYDDRGAPTDWRILEVNDAYAHHTGISRDQVVGRRISELFPAAIPEFLSRFAEVVATQKSTSFETFSKLTNRHQHIVSFPAGPNRFANTITDITARKLADEALREREHKYHTLIDRMIDGFALHEIVIDASGRPRDYLFLEVNKAFERLTGLRGADIIGKCVTEVLPGIWESDFNWIKAYGNVALTGEELRTEQYSEELGKWYSITAYSPQKGFFATIFEDITERKRVEEALRQSREDLNRAQEVGSIGSWRLDIRRNVLTWSDENHRIFGIPKGTPMTYETFLSVVHPDDRATVDARWSAALRGEHYDIEHRLIVDDQVKWVREKAYLEFDKSGSLVGGFGITQDITERKKVEEALQKLNEELEQRVAQRTRFFNVLARSREAIVRQRDEKTLFDELCRIIVDTGGFRLAWIGIVDQETRDVRPVAQYGATGYLDGLRVVAADVPEGRGPTGRAIVEGQHVINLDFEQNVNMLPWRERARAYGLRSSSSFPLRNGDRIIGAVTIYSDRPSFFSSEEISILSSLAEDISFAIATMANDAKRKQAEHRTELINELLILFTRESDRTAFLDAAIERIRRWSGCRHVGIRVADERGNIPYVSCSGFGDEFLDSERTLSLQQDHCACTRVVRGEPEAQDLHAMTPAGSFFSNNTAQFIESLPEEKRSRFRGVCMRSGFLSLAVVPIRYRDKVLGAIHVADDLADRVPFATVEFLEQVALIIGEALFRFSVEQESSQLAAAVESAADAVVVTEPDRGTILYVNDSFEKMTGYTRDEAVGKTVHLLDSGRHDDAFFDDLRTALQRDGVWRGQLINMKKDGTLYFEDCTFSPVRDHAGKLLNYVSVRRDITEKLRLESIAESVSMLDNMGAIFAGVRHEIGNPINNAKIHLSVLQQKLDILPTGRVREYVDRTLSEIGRVEHLLHTLKTFNLFETPSLEDMATGPLLELFRGLVREDLGARGITLSTQILPGAEHVRANSRMLQHVLLNLTTNAADALKDRPQPRIDIMFSREDDRVRIRVSDNGRGMNRDQIANLFKPFHTTKQHGTGLGLVIVKKMITTMEGTIDIASHEGSGTAVTIYLPGGNHAGTA